MKKGLLLALALCIFYSAHAAWYDAPVRWFKQGVAWMRKSSYDAYQKALALGGYQAYQQQKPVVPTAISPIPVASPNVFNRININKLAQDIEAAIIMYQLLKDIKYLELHYATYPDLRNKMLNKYPILSNLSEYESNIANLKQKQLALPRLPDQEKIIQSLIIWIGYMKAYFDNPFDSPYTLFEIYNNLQAAALNFKKIGANLTSFVEEQFNRQQ